MNAIQVPTVHRIKSRAMMSPELAEEARKWETPAPVRREPAPSEPTTDRAPPVVRFDLD